MDHLRHIKAVNTYTTTLQCIAIATSTWHRNIQKSIRFGSIHFSVGGELREGRKDTSKRLQDLVDTNMEEATQIQHKVLVYLA